MQNHEPQRWSFFRNLAQDEFARKDVSLMDQDHIAYSSPLGKVDEGVVPKPYKFTPSESEGVGLGHLNSQINFDEELQQDLSGIIEEDPNVLQKLSPFSRKNRISMEGIGIRTPAPRIRVPISKSKSFECRKNLTPMDNQRNPPILRCIRAEEESTGTSGSVTYNNNSVMNLSEVREGECGKSLDNVLENQGIRIRRRPPTGPPTHAVGPFEFRLENEGNTPRNILEKIMWHKDTEIAKLRERKPLAELSRNLSGAPPAKDFVGALRASYERTGKPALIAEIKKASPSRGVLREDFDPIQIANAYERNGAACLSVLTDKKFFQGSFENLEDIRRTGVKCPLLCKEFIIDAWQIYYARSKGADAILLIAAILPDLDIKYMTKICSKLGLAVLVEVHTEREMDRVLGIDGIQLIGINNRNLETFEVDLSNTKKLLEGERGEIIRQRDIIVVGESGLFTPEDISYVQDAGVKAVLVGESLIRQDDPGKGIAGLFGEDISVSV